MNHCFATLLSLSILGLAPALFVGCSREREPPHDAPPAVTERFTDVSLVIDEKDVLVGEQTFAAGETYPVKGRFRLVDRDSKATHIGFRLLVDVDGKMGIMNSANVEPQATEDGLVTFQAPFRMTPKPGRYEFRVECELDRKFREAKENVVASAIVRVIEAESSP